MVGLRHLFGVGEQEVRIALQMDQSSGLHDVGVAIHETGAGKSLVDLLHLRIAEGNPDLGHFVGGEELLNQLDVRANKGHISEVCLQGLGSSRPHACPLDVDADEILVGIALGKSYGIFSLAASQFENDGMLIVEIFFVPTSLQGETCSLQLFEGILQAVGIGCHVGELGQFVLCCHLKK